MTCVHSFIYSVLVNGKTGITFSSERGLCQGDLFSPYLFLFGVESLSSMIKMVEQRGEIQGVVIARGGNRLSHLFFANDNLLFCRASLAKWTKLKNILSLYEKGLGHIINELKSTIFLSLIPLQSQDAQCFAHLGEESAWIVIGTLACLPLLEDSNTTLFGRSKKYSRSV